MTSSFLLLSLFALGTVRAEDLTLPLGDDVGAVDVWHGWWYNGGGTHEGIDYICSTGDTIVAAADGIAMHGYEAPTSSTDVQAYGNLVRIIHEDGLETRYAHLDSVESFIPYKTDRGATDYGSWAAVSVGQKIGTCGTTGTSWEHLHFEAATAGIYPWGRMDPYDLESQSWDYPDDATTGSCGSDHLWSACPPVRHEGCTEHGPFTVALALAQDNGSTYTISTWYLDDGGTLSLYGEVGEGLSSARTSKWLVGSVDHDVGFDLFLSYRRSSTRDYYVFSPTGDGGFYSGEQWGSFARADARYTMLGDVDDDGDDDLIVASRDASDQYFWSTCESDGESFSGSCVEWPSNDSSDGHFAERGDVLLVADLNGDGKVELVRGRVSTDASCGGKLKWRRLKRSGNTETIDDCWGEESHQYLVGDPDGDGADEIVRINTNDSTVEATVGQYDTSSHSLNTSRWQRDVGGTDGWYYLADIDDDGLDDILRWTDRGTLVWMASSGAGFAAQTDQVTLLEDLWQVGSDKDENDFLFFRDFGDHGYCGDSSTATVTATTTLTTTFGSDCTLAADELRLAADDESWVPSDADYLDLGECESTADEVMVAMGDAVSEASCDGFATLLVGAADDGSLWFEFGDGRIGSSLTVTATLFADGLCLAFVTP